MLRRADPPEGRWAWRGGLALPDAVLTPPAPPAAARLLQPGSLLLGTWNARAATFGGRCSLAAFRSLVDGLYAPAESWEARCAEEDALLSS